MAVSRGIVKDKTRWHKLTQSGKVQSAEGVGGPNVKTFGLFADVAVWLSFQSAPGDSLGRLLQLVRRSPPTRLQVCSSALPVIKFVTLRWCPVCRTAQDLLLNCI